jgi:hypothetical protein
MSNDTDTQFSCFRDPFWIFCHESLTHKSKYSFNLQIEPHLAIQFLQSVLTSSSWLYDCCFLDPVWPWVLDPLSVNQNTVVIYQLNWICPYYLSSLYSVLVLIDHLMCLLSQKLCTLERFNHPASNLQRTCFIIAGRQGSTEYGGGSWTHIPGWTSVTSWRWGCFSKRYYVSSINLSWFCLSFFSFTSI